MVKHGKHTKESYDWLEDPFNEEKQKEDQLSSAHMSSKSCLLLLIAGILVIGILVFGCIVGFGFMSMAFASVPA